MSGLPKSLALIGAGKMGGAMLEGWLALGLAPESVAVIEPHPGEALLALCARRGLRLNPRLADVAAPDVVVLAIKPQMLEAAAAEVNPLLAGGGLLVSILAGKTIADLSARLPAARAIARAMPNTPAAIGRGITGVFANSPTSPAQRAITDALLRAVGAVVWLAAEDQIDAVTALSGSGPAYVFYLAEALAQAGEAVGLPQDVAAQLARATVEGAGELLHRSPGTTPAQLRANVTSPGGTTAAALEALMAADGLTALMTRAVAAAKRRAGELSG